jgi:hypothetical protein
MKRQARRAGGGGIGIDVGADAGKAAAGSRGIVLRPGPVFDGPHRYLVGNDVVNIVQGPNAAVEGFLQKREVLAVLALQARALVTRMLPPAP